MSTLAWILVVGGVVVFYTVLVVVVLALCAAARLGDEILTRAYREMSGR